MGTSRGQRPPAAAAGKAVTARELPPGLLAGIVDNAPVGIAVAGPDGTCSYVNDCGRRLLGAATAQQAARAVGASGGTPGRLARRWPGLRFSEAPPVAGSGQRVILIHPAGRPRPEPWLPGLSRAATRVSETGSLIGALDAIAAEIRSRLQLAAVNIVVPGAAGTGLLGGAGFAGTAAERSARMRRCDALGADFRHREAVRARRAVVVPHRYDAVMRDPRWAPAHHALAAVAWDGFAAVPLEARGHVIGTLSAFYPAAAGAARELEVERLTAVAGQVALAVEHASLLAWAGREAAARERSRPGLAALTPRERQVLGLLAEGCSNREIARRLAITERTARTHVSNLLGKLRLASRTQAALLARQEGFPAPAG